MKSEPTTSMITSTASDDPTTSKHSGKKRLSKQERKQLKKQKKLENSDKEHDVTQEPTKVTLASEQKEEQLHQQEEDQEPDYLKSFQPIPVPIQPSKELLASNNKKAVVDDDDHEGGGRTLGKWFPNALLVKCCVNYSNTGKLVLNGLSEDSARVENPKSSLVLFYQYTNQRKWSQTQVKLLMTYLSCIAKERNIGGRIRVAQEGVNATVSAVDMPRVTAKETLRHFVQDLKHFDSEVFANTDFKFMDNLPADRHFKELKVMPVQELVFYGIKQDDAPLDNDDKVDGIKGGVHLEAKEYHEMLKQDNTVVIDVRNHYETIIGRFDGQQVAASTSTACGTEKECDTKKKAGATYIDPLMRKSTDFKSWLGKDETKKQLKDKNVLMYCTGGIRCERASAYLKKEMGDKVEGVYQLQGGVERYLKAFPDGGFWRGKNFVFDKREAVGVENPEGDGGVIRKQTKKKKTKEELGSLTSKCCVCECPWDRYVGKKKCFTCGVPVLMCEKCMSKKPDKTPGMELKVRCPLCVEENITVPASEVEFTANGIKNKADQRGDAAGSAAESVLKWGGGHASEKKMSRKMKRRLCQFGSECLRSDCFFAHPDRENDGRGKTKQAKAS
jgi:predicted sulfurtransferase